MVIPGLLIWSLGIPLFVWHRMHANKQKLTENDLKIKYKTLFSGYSESHYY